VSPCVAPEDNDGKQEENGRNGNVGSHQHKGDTNGAPVRALTISWWKLTTDSCRLCAFWLRSFS